MFASSKDIAWIGVVQYVSLGSAENMPRMKHFERGRATAFLDDGVPVREVARRLGVSLNAIRKLRTKFHLSKCLAQHYSGIKKQDT